MIALISDIHSNLEALNAVLQNIKDHGGVTKIYCLGDIVGYGPNPLECTEIIMNCDKTIMGNHEQALLNNAFGFNKVAKQAIQWTRSQLKPSLLGGRKKKAWKFLKSLKTHFTENNILYVHGSPREPTNEYLTEEAITNAQNGISTTLDENFALMDKICFMGHTHKPGVITNDYKFYNIDDLNYRYTFLDYQKVIVNIGSVGQPRDNDNRASYVIYNPVANEIIFKRVEYDYQTTIAKIEAINNLNNQLGQRLSDGA